MRIVVSIFKWNKILFFDVFLLPKLSYLLKIFTLFVSLKNIHCQAYDYGETARFINENSTLVYPQTSKLKINSSVYEEAKYLEEKFGWWCSCSFEEISVSQIFFAIL
jgi:hypothetical protein